MECESNMNRLILVPENLLLEIISLCRDFETSAKTTDAQRKFNELHNKLGEMKKISKPSKSTPTGKKILMGFDNYFLFYFSWLAIFTRLMGLLYSGGLSHFQVSVGGHNQIFLEVYGPEIIGGCGLKSQNTKAVCSLDEQTMAFFRMCDPSLIYLLFFFS